MSTVVTKTGSIAENLSSGLSGAVNWNSPNNALAEDGNNAFAVFTSGNTRSNYLYIHGFNANLPDTAVVEGVRITVKKRAAGPVADHSAYLVYLSGSELAFTSENKALPDDWTSIYQNTDYGGATDQWGESFSYTDLNNSTFGFALAAEGDGSINNGPVIDSYTLNVYYHQLINQTVSGGGGMGGSAAVTSSTSVTAEAAGATGAGRVTFTESPTISGGSFISGSAPNESGLFTSGGSFASGSAEIVVRYTGDRQANTYEFNCIGRHEVPPDNAHGDVAQAQIHIDPTTRRLTWKITHSLTAADSVRFRGPAVRGQSASAIISLENLGSTASPIVGGSNLTIQEASDLQSGLWYLAIRNDTDSIRLRNQVTNDVQAASGSATVLKVYTHVVEGGGLAAGIANARVSLNPLASGGAALDGESNSFVAENVEGGALGDGYNNMTYTAAPAITGGVQLLGETWRVNTVSNVGIESAGSTCGGMAVVGINVPVGGGATVSGLATETKFTNIVVTGGVRGNGSHVLQQTYAAQDVVGGIRIFGATPAEKLKRYTKSVILGVARSMGTPNKVNDPELLERMRNRTSTSTMTVPVPKVSPFSLRRQPGYTEFGETGEDAYLPEIIKKRQKEILPPKAGATVVSNRQIATASIST